MTQFACGGCSGTILYLHVQAWCGGDSKRVAPSSDIHAAVHAEKDHPHAQAVNPCPADVHGPTSCAECAHSICEPERQCLNWSNQLGMVSRLCLAMEIE